MGSVEAGTQYVRCLKCLKIIKCSRYDTLGLIDHIRSAHPEIFKANADANSNANTDNKDQSKTLRQLASEVGVSDANISHISRVTGLSETQLVNEASKFLSRQEKNSSSTSKARIQPIDSRDLNRRQYYRTSIEKWTPTDGCIYCPKCGCSRRPLLRTHSEVFSSNKLCASCVISCWPLCFLPCLISPENKEYMHCSNCKTFLGLYDREHNCVKPNREFVIVEQPPCGPKTKQ